MKRFILFGCSFIALFIASCLGSKNSEVSTISLAQKENAKALMLEEVPTNDVLEFAERCFVFDSILVVQNYSNSNKHLLFVLIHKVLSVDSLIFYLHNKRLFLITHFIC
jgi:hypothetical protein